MKLPPYPLALTAIVSAAGAAIIVSGIYRRAPDLITTLFGDIGILPFGVAVMTVVFLGINARTATLGLQNTQLALRQSEQAEVAARFQKGIEMLSSPAEATRIGGLYILRDVVVVAASAYWESVVDSVIPFIRLGCKASKEYYWHLDERETFEGPTDEQISLEPTPPDILVALKLVGAHDPRVRAAVADLPKRHLKLDGLVLAHCALEELDLSGLYVEQLIAEQVTFHRCLLSGSAFNLKSGNVSFHDCDLHGAGISIEFMILVGCYAQFRQCDLSEATINAHERGTLDVQQCDLDGTNFAGNPGDIMDSWHHGQPPFRTTGSSEVIRATRENLVGTTPGGMSIFR